MQISETKVDHQKNVVNFECACGTKKKRVRLLEPIRLNTMQWLKYVKRVQNKFNEIQQKIYAFDTIIYWLGIHLFFFRLYCVKKFDRFIRISR